MRHRHRGRTGGAACTWSSRARRQERRRHRDMVTWARAEWSGWRATCSWWARKLQQEAGVEFTVEEAFNHIMEHAHPHSRTPCGRQRAPSPSPARRSDQFNLTTSGKPTGLRARPVPTWRRVCVRALTSRATRRTRRRRAKARDAKPPPRVRGKQQVSSCSTRRQAAPSWKTAHARVVCAVRGRRRDRREAAKAVTIVATGGGFLGNVDMMREKFGTS